MIRDLQFNLEFQKKIFENWKKSLIKSYRIKRAEFHFKNLQIMSATLQCASYLKKIVFK